MQRAGIFDASFQCAEEAPRVAEEAIHGRHSARRRARNCGLLVQCRGVYLLREPPTRGVRDDPQPLYGLHWVRPRSREDGFLWVSMQNTHVGPGIGAADESCTPDVCAHRFLWLEGNADSASLPVNTLFVLHTGFAADPKSGMDFGAVSRALGTYICRWCFLRQIVLET